MAFPNVPSRVVAEFQNQLSSDKRHLGFLLGAGCSMAVGIPGIDGLTEKVKETLTKDEVAIVDSLCSENGASGNIEVILNRVRTLRELIGDSLSQEYHGLKGGNAARLLDRKICKSISSTVNVDPTKGYQFHRIFAQWTKHAQSNRKSPIELFTTNYDLLLEKSFEDLRIPFFDGFVGSVQPFFLPDSVQPLKSESLGMPPASWVRIWKLHGSVNWCVRKDEHGLPYFMRLAIRELKEDDDLMIFPSKDKYLESRKLPFLSYHDRFRDFLLNGETMLVVVGYSFGDQHLNETMFQALRSNRRLSITALMYGDVVAGSQTRVLSNEICRYANDNPNLTIIGPDKVCMGGIQYNWAPDEETGKHHSITPSSYWSEADSMFTLGGFTAFSLYLQNEVGFTHVTAPQQALQESNEE